jgi:hypothetical protein
VFENRVLRNVIEPKREETTGGWGKLNNEELQNLYSSLGHSNQGGWDGWVM